MFYLYSVARDNRRITSTVVKRFRIQNTNSSVSYNMYDVRSSEDTTRVFHSSQKIIERRLTLVWCFPKDAFFENAPKKHFNLKKNKKDVVGFRRTSGSSTKYYIIHVTAPGLFLILISTGSSWRGLALLLYVLSWTLWTRAARTFNVTRRASPFKLLNRWNCMSRIPSELRTETTCCLRITRHFRKMFSQSKLGPPRLTGPWVTAKQKLSNE